VYDKGVDVDVQDDQTRRQILISYRTGDMHAPELDRREALSLVAQEFADSIAQNRAPLTDAAAGVRVVALLEAADRSLRAQGRRIRI
jgi:predicted dehydrogenase